MKLHELRSVRAVIASGFRVTVAADAVHGSQPGISRHLQSVEAELGVEVFEREDLERRGKGYALSAFRRAARAQGRVHGVILMVELGDLREGITPADLGAEADRGDVAHARALPVARGDRGLYPGVSRGTLEAAARSCRADHALARDRGGGHFGIGGTEPASCVLAVPAVPPDASNHPDASGPSTAQAS